MLPSIFGENLFDDFFRFPEIRDFDRAERKLYGGHAGHIMKTDVREHEGGYEIDIDLPGFKKEEINVELKEGYLTVSAAKSLENKDEKKGKVIRQERFAGAAQRSFYVGDNLTEEDIKAAFNNGVLSLTVPKKEARIPEKKTIMIEG